MTAQIPDKFLYNGKEYYFIKASNEFGFVPQNYDVKPCSFITSNWRGFYCDYVIVKNMLYLDNITISGGSKKFHEKFGSYWSGRNEYGSKYKHIMIGMKYRGKILMGRDVISEYCFYSGFQCASAYREVIEICVSDGRVIKVLDYSNYVEKHREEIYHAEIYEADEGEKGVWHLIKSILRFGNKKYWWEQEKSE